MELYQLEYFREVCVCGNYTKAAQVFQITQPAITSAIKKLETECGGKLFEHQGKKLQLTKLGKILLRHANIILNEVEITKTDLERCISADGEISRLGIPMTLCPDILAAVSAKYLHKHRSPSLIISQSAPEHIASAILSQELEMGIICSAFADESFETLPLGNAEFWVFFSPAHPFKEISPITPDMLSGQRLLVPGTPIGVSKYSLDYMKNHNVDAEYMGVGNIIPPDALPLAESGAGIAFLEKSLPSQNKAPLDPPLLIDLVLAWRKDMSMTEEKRELINFITACRK